VRNFLKSKKVGLWGAVIMGLAFMAPALSILATYSLVFNAGYTYTAVPLAYLIAGVVIILTAISFAELVKVFPKSGSVWDFASGVFNAKFGQFTTWIYLLDLLVVPAAALVPVGFYALDWLGIPAWATVLVLMLFVTFLAALGMTLSLRVMAILFVTELVILLVFAAQAISWSMNIGLFQTTSAGSLSLTSSLWGWMGVMMGATIAVFCFMGFETPATLSEEAEAPTRNVPLAIVICAVVGTLLYFFFSWAFTLAVPATGLLTILYYVNPIPKMAGTIAGPQMAGLLNLAGIVAGTTCALAGVTASTRILSKLGRDAVFPHPFKIMSKRFGTPIFSVLFVAVIGLLLSEYTPWEVIAYLIAAGALPTFMITNFMAFWHFRREGWKLRNVLLHGIVPWLAIAMSGWFIAVGMPPHMKMILLLWIVVGAVLVYLNACFRPAAFLKTADTKVPHSSWLGLAISIIATAGVVAYWIVWYPAFSGELLWWHHFYPYIWESAVGQGIVIVLAIAFIAAMAYLLYRKRMEKEN
jgi:putrescine importer